MSRRAKSWKRLGAGTLLLVLVVLFSWGFEKGRAWITEPGRFPVSDVRVIGNRLLWEGEVQEMAGAERGANLFQIDTGAMERRLEETAWVREASVKRRPPGRLLIEIEENEPWLLTVQEEPLFIGRDGTLFPTLGKEERLDLPFLVDRSGKGVRIVPLLSEAFPPEEDWVTKRVSRILIDSTGSVTFREMRFGARVEFGSVAFARKAERLRSVMAEWERKREGFEEIDFRYKGQAIARGKSVPPRGRRS